MRPSLAVHLVPAVLCASALAARAQPAAPPAASPAPPPATPAPPPTADWTDTPALLAAATAPVAADLRACLDRPGPRRITVVATRDGDRTAVAMPLPAVGGRGLTPEERCLMKTVARVALPPLPAPLERVHLLHVITAAGVAPPATEAGFAAWRDPAATVNGFLDARRRAALGGCAARPRTVRLVLDLRRSATRLWLPAWQFHSPSHDGTTPPAEQRVKACLRRAVRGWTLPPLPRAMAELELAIPVRP